MKTRHFCVTDLIGAADLLRAGELVAFPTETVYGLGANALDELAVQKIFLAKGRPSDNPLIVHVSEATDVYKVASSVPPIAKELMERFWPGPLTLVLPKRNEISTLVTAGLDTIAVRVPNHAVALELVRLAGLPIAAPSANRSGKPSATTWQAVAEDLDGLIAGIICGEACQWGLESTVVDVTCNPPRVLRPGGASLESLREVAPNLVPYSPNSNSKDPSNSPGLRHKHYQPKAKVIVVDSSQSLVDQIPTATRCNYIGVSPPSDPTLFATVVVCEDVQQYGAKLFDFFRNSDSCGVDLLCCSSVPEIGIGVALMDRLRRASQS